MRKMTPAERKQLEREGFVVIDEPMIYASISRLAELTVVDRHTAAHRLKLVGLQSRKGPKGAALYLTCMALPAIVRDYKFV